MSTTEAAFRPLPPAPFVAALSSAAAGPLTPPPGPHQNRMADVAGEGGLTAMLRAMVDEDSRGSSVNSSTGSGAKRSPNVDEIPPLVELRKSIDQLDLDATRRRVFDHKLEALRAQFGHSQKHMRECTDFTERIAQVTWDSYQEVLRLLARPNIVTGEAEVLECLSLDDYTEELREALEDERQLLEANKDVDAQLRAEMGSLIGVPKRSAPVPQEKDHLMDHQYRPVMHAPHDKFIDSPNSRDPSLGPKGHRKRHRKGHKSKGLPEATNAPVAAIAAADVQHEKHEHRRQVQRKHHHNHGHAYHPHEPHHHGKAHHHQRSNDYKKREEWETSETGFAASASQASIGSAHGLSFREASFKLSSVPKKHFMGEQSDLEHLEEAGETNRKLRRRRQQEQQRRDKAVRKQINNQSRTGQSIRDSFQAFDPFDTQFPSYMGHEDSTRVSTYSPWDPSFQSHAAYRPWAGEIEEGSSRRVGSKKSRKGRKGKSKFSGVRRRRYQKAYEGQWGSYYPVSPWSDEWVAKTFRKGGRLRGVRANSRKPRHFQAFSPFDQRFATACQVSFHEYDDPNDWFKSYSPWNEKFPHRYSSPKKGWKKMKKVTRSFEITRWHQLEGRAVQQEQ
ncbi:hypothetical protein FOZ62_026758, partial [Perkinsus olseni]